MKDSNIEKRLADLIRMFGKKNSNNGYTLGVSSMKLIINGNFCEEFEDIDNAPCIVNYIAVDSSSITPWFNMQATTGMVGLVWGDKYSIGAMGSANVKKIVDYVESTYGTTTTNKEKLMELRRAKWLSIASDNRTEYLKGIYNDGKSGCDFDHAVDCIYSCYSRDKSDNLNLTLDELKNNILKTINKTEAFFIRIKYPTRASLMSSCYLARQDGERYARWSHIIPLINKRIHKMIKPHEIKELIACDPNDVLVDGRLRDDKPANVKTVVKKKAEVKTEIRQWPAIYSAESYGIKDMSTNDWCKWQKEKEAEYAKIVKKLGHPRFEVVIDEKYRQYYQLQIMGIVWMYSFNPYDKDRNKNPEYAKQFAKFYNGTKETSIPVDGTIVIDHFDKDKTPYLLGDIIRICDDGYKEDPGKGFFCRIDTPNGSNIVTFDFMRVNDIDDRDWHKNRYSQTARNIHGSICKPKRMNRKMAVSQRTGMSYAQMGYHARISSNSIKALWNEFDAKFKEDEQELLNNDMLSFDHEKFALSLQEADSPLHRDEIDVVPHYYRRGYFEFVTKKTGYSTISDIPRDRMLQAQRAWWTSIYRDVLQSAMRAGRKDTLDYDLLKENQDLIPCEFDKVGYYYLTPDKNLNKPELDIAEKVRLVVNAILNKKNKPALQPL